MTYLIILWGVVDVLGHIRDEYSDILLAATLFKAIVYNTMRIFIYTLFDSTTLLLDVITLANFAISPRSLWRCPL
jgi:hypothetical protein